MTNRLLLVAYLFGAAYTAAACWLLCRWIRRNPDRLAAGLSGVLKQLHARLRVDDHWSERGLDGRKGDSPEEREG